MGEKMKKKTVGKIMGLLLAGVVVLGSQTEVRAEGSSLTFQKTYKLKDNAQTGASSPAEVFSFESTETTPAANSAKLYAVSCTKYNDAAALDTIKAYTELSEEAKAALRGVSTLTLGQASYTAGEVTSTTPVAKNVQVTAPEASAYPSVGYYYYEFRETAGDTAGVTYSSDTCVLRVAVVRDDTTGQVSIGSVKLMSRNAEGSLAKKDSITNLYSAGTLTIEKQVTGNMGDRDKEFIVTVTFDAENQKIKAPISITTQNAGTTTNTTALAPDASGSSSLSTTISVKNGTKVTFSNIPEGVTYSVTETQANGYDAPEYYLNNTKQSGTSVSGTLADSASGGSMNPAVKIVNHKESVIDTGIILSNLPYLLTLLGIAAVTALYIAMKHHHQKVK